MTRLVVIDARAEALFVTDLQRSDRPSAAQVREAVATAIRTYGSRGCAEEVAAEFGDHPETAVERMRWACDTVRAAFPTGGSVRAVRRRNAQAQYRTAFAA
jgi:hypothetical protein